MLILTEVLDFLEALAPSKLAADWDNIGLLLGDRSAPVDRIMTCLTVTPDSAAEAIESKANLIVTHHPILFRPIQRLTTDTSAGRMLLSLAQAGIAVYSPHTAFDNTRDGINDILARQFGLLDVEPLRRGEGESRYKVVVFVPDADLTKVADSMFAAGAGNIGQYTQCSFRLAGTGTFFGSEQATPTIGTKGRREEVQEWRLEAICPANNVDRVISAIRKSHSYEEPAFDVYPLRPSSTSCGEGRLGRLPSALPLSDLARAVKNCLGANVVQAVGSPERAVQRIAIVCGAGGQFLSDAMRSHADVLLTGEMRFHDYLAAQAGGIALILPGHYATERCGIEHLARLLQEQWPQAKVWACLREHDPICAF